MSYMVEPPTSYRAAPPSCSKASGSKSLQIPYKISNPKKEIVHPAPLEGWTSSKVHIPAANKVVIGWDGDAAVKCLFSSTINKWTDSQGTPIQISMWTDSKV